MDLTKFYVYDIETYKQVFTVSVIRADGKHKHTFVCSKWQNDIERIFKFMDHCRENEIFAVGFNSLGFDYPVLHDLLELRTKNKVPKTGLGIAHKVFEFAQKQIDSFKDDGFGRTIKSEERYFKQIDLYKVHHMNNKAKRTSLKMLEFVMQMDNIEELPFEIDADLSEQDIKKLVAYNEHDVKATLRFFLASQSQVQFRLDLGEKLGRDFTNADDTKIGSEFFEMRLEDAGVKLYRYQDGKRILNQSKRDKIAIKDCLVDYYEFHHPEFQAVYNWFKKQVITETKGVFSDIEEHNLGELAKYAELTTKRKKFKSKPDQNELQAFYKEHPMGWVEEEELKATEYAFDANGEHILEYVLDEDGCPDLSKKPKKKRVPKKSYYGCWKIAETLNTKIGDYRIDFGVGGVHASLSEKVVRENSKYMIRDADVSSMYPNIAISNRLYPEHLTEKFCDIYESLYEERKTHPKGSAENAMLKLSLNGCYGKSNDKFSVFYDPKFTMSITINGQLSLLMLADRLLQIRGLKLIQLNTDGITVAMLRETEEEYNTVCKTWEKAVGLELEFADYTTMFIRDVNNYVAVYTNGKVKRKGAYQYEGLGWHQNSSALVIPRAAEAAMIEGVNLKDFITKHFEAGNIHDFMLRTKVDRSSKLVSVDSEGVDHAEQRICRYYISNEGRKLVKIMKPLEGNTEYRRLSIDAQWFVKTCNNMKDFDGDINFDYYVSEAEKLVIGAK